MCYFKTPVNTIDQIKRKYDHLLKKMEVLTEWKWGQCMPCAMKCKHYHTNVEWPLRKYIEDLTDELMRMDITELDEFKGILESVEELQCVVPAFPCAASLQPKRIFPSFPRKEWRKKQYKTLRYPYRYEWKDIHWIGKDL